MEANSVGKKNDRLNRLIGILKIRGAVSIRELAQTLEVSEITIRRDMKLLQQNKVVENVDGVMVYNPAHTLVETDKEYSLALEEERRNAEKAAIGAFAASLVAQDDMIIIDTGTTTVHIARNLPTNLHLSVLCYNINILMELRRKPNIQPLFAGGYYHANAQMFESKEGVEFISGIRVQKAFVSAAGVHCQLGVTCINNYEIETKRAILRSSLEKILVADSSKFGRVCAAYCCDMNDIDTIITNKDLSPEWIDQIRSKGIKLYLV